MDTTLASQLAAGCDRLGCQLDAAQQERLLAYLALLLKWNRAYNLTAVREPSAMVTRHLLDSLAVLPWLGGRCFADVGSGAGLPGIPLAIACPDREFHLVDSNGKKTRFLFQVKTALGLANMTVHHRRVEQFRPPQAFDAVLSRAFASLADMIRSTRHLLRRGGLLLAMKGACPDEELAAVAGLCEVVNVIPLSVPGLEERRHLVVLALTEPSTLQGAG